MGIKSPCCIDSSDTRESFKSPPILLSGSNNYPQWRRSMARELNSKEKEGFVYGTTEVPPKDHPNYGAWKECNEMVVSWIVKSVSPEIASSVREMENAVDVWRNLKNRFSPGDLFMILDILGEIHSFTQGDRDVGSYYKEFCVLWSDLELLRAVPVCTCERKCSCGAMQRMKEQIEQEKVGRFLKGLDDHRFDGIRSRIMRKEGPLPPFSQVRLSVFQEDTHMVIAPQQSQPPSTKSKQVIPNTPPQKEAIQFLSIHPHPLTWKPARESYICSGCKELAFGPSYRCESSDCTDCNEINGIFILDEDCAEAVIHNNNNNKNSPVGHPFYKNRKLYFIEKPRRFMKIKPECNACKKDVEGFSYRCSETDVVLHPRCFKLKSSVSNEEWGVTLKLHKKILLKTAKCQRCMKSNQFLDEKGWCYVSSNGDCCIHVSCFKELIHENRDFFKQVLSSKDPGEGNQIEAIKGKKVVKAGGSSSGTTKVVRTEVSVAFKLIFSVIFGDPVSFVLGLLDVLAAANG